MAEVVNLMEKSEEKKKALEAALSQIEKNYGKGSVMKLGDPENVVEIEAISTGSLGLDVALGIGGLPKGQLLRFTGRKAPVKRLWRCIRWPKRKKPAAFAALLMPSTRSTRPMPISWASILRNC